MVSKLGRVKVTVRIPKSDLETIDHLITLGAYTDRSECIRDSIRYLTMDRIKELREEYENRKWVKNEAVAEELAGRNKNGGKDGRSIRRSKKTRNQRGA